MTGIKRSPEDFSIEQLDRELVARGARIPAAERYRFTDLEGTPERNEIMQQTEKLYRAGDTIPLNESLSHISIRQLADTLFLKITEAESNRARRGGGERMDIYEIADRDIRRNARTVVSIWMKQSLEDKGNRYFSLKQKKYGNSFNLHRSEPYYHQPIAVGRLCTGFLVKDNVIATAGHCADEHNLKDLYFVFGYEMRDSDDPVTAVPKSDVYSGVEIVRRVYDPHRSGADWALVKLDRAVSDRDFVSLSKTGVRGGDPVYVLGHPCGLPLKYVPDEPVQGIERAFFSAELSVYGGNSGSPVFCSKTHRVVGIVVRGDSQDFRWTGSGWMSVRYPSSGFRSCAPQCTGVSEFINHCR